MNAKQYLRQAYRLDELIQCNQRELDELRILAVSLPGTDYSKERVQSTPCGDASYTNIIAKIDELERVIKADIDSMLKLKIEIRKVVDKVRDNEEKLVLKLRYLNFNTWDEICSEMKLSMRTVLRIHIRALNNVIIPE